MKIKFSVILIFTAAACWISAEAGFKDYGWGARGAGKAGAIIATVNDASAVMWNPAGLTDVENISAMLSYHKPYAGLEGVSLGLGMAAVAYPLSGGALGVSATTFDGDGKYGETIIQLTAASKLFNTERIAWGLNFKYLSNKYHWDDEILQMPVPDPVTEKDGANAFTFDAGLRLLPYKRLPVGITLKNILPADVGIAHEDIVPMELKAGMGYRLDELWVLKNVTPEVVVGYRDQYYEDGRVSWGAGVEGWLPCGTVGIRSGVNNNEVTAGASFERVLGSVALRLDYAAILSMTFGDNYGSHRISLSIRDL